MRWVLFLVVFLPVLASGAVCEATGSAVCLYVNGASGADTNTGTFEAPFKTVKRADWELESRIPSQAPGSYIYVLPGNYQENKTPIVTQHGTVNPDQMGIQLRADGAVGNPLTLKSYDPSQPAVLYGQLNMTARSGGHAVVFFDGANHYVISGFIVENGTSGIAGIMTNVIVENNLIRNMYSDTNANPAGVSGWDGNRHVIIRQNRIYNIGANASSPTPNSNLMCIVTYSGNNYTVHNNDLSNCLTGIKYKHQATPVAGETPYSQYFRNNIYGTSDGIIAGTSGIHIYENIVYNSSNGIWIGIVDGGRPVHNNSIYHNSIHVTNTGLTYSYSSGSENTYNTSAYNNVITAAYGQYIPYDWQRLRLSNFNCYSSTLFKVPYVNPLNGELVATGTIANMTANGHDVNSAIHTNQYVNPSRDLRLTADSPCRTVSNSSLLAGAYTSDNPAYTIGATQNTLITQGDYTPPVRSTGSSTPAANTAVISLTTNERATCRYGNASVSFNGMTIFGPADVVTHSTTITGLQSNRSYSYYIRCQDINGNYNTDDYPVSFTTTNGNTGPGDSNRDGSVNLLDVIFVSTYLDKTTFDTDADINGDDAVNLFDLVGVVKNWGMNY
jgi:hypothetical protein